MVALLGTGLFVVVSLLTFLPAGAQQIQSSYPVLQGGTHPAELVRSLLVEKHGIVLQDTRIVGTLSLDSIDGIREFSATRVTFDHVYDRDSNDHSLYFSESTFLERADFSRSHFRDLTIEFSEAIDDVDLVTVIADDLILRGSTFKKDVTFIGAEIAELHLGHVRFEGNVSFNGATIETANALRVRSKTPIEIEWSQIRTSWYKHTTERIEGDQDKAQRDTNLRNVEDQLLMWKDNFTRLGKKGDALKVNAELVRFRRAHFMSTTERIATWLLDIPTGYGTEPFRLFWASTAIVFAFGALYSIDGVLGEDPGRTTPAWSRRPAPIFGVLYSLESFLPVVSIFKPSDWGWTIAERFRWVEMTEKMLGVGILSLAAYSIKAYAF